MLKKWITAFVAAIFLGLIIAACDTQQPGLYPVDIWARPGMQDGNSAVFFDIVNGSEVEDRLIDAKSDIASAVEIHETTMVDSAMKMERQLFVNIPPGETISFKPGGLHVMLIGLQKQLNPGDSFPITLFFENTGEIEVLVPVQEP